MFKDGINYLVSSGYAFMKITDVGPLTNIMKMDGVVTGTERTKDEMGKYQKCKEQHNYRVSSIGVEGMECTKEGHLNNRWIYWMK